MNTQKINIDELIEKAKALSAKDSRHKNRGRPKIGMPKEEIEVISKLRQKKISVSTIYDVMKAEGITRYNTYAAFNHAWQCRD